VEVTDYWSFPKKTEEKAEPFVTLPKNTNSSYQKMLPIIKDT